MVSAIQNFSPNKADLFSLSPANKEEGGYLEGISEEEIKYDTFAAGKKLSVNVSGEVIGPDFTFLLRSGFDLMH